MADSKKYYWLKLKRDFFKRHDIRIIEEMPNGKDYILFYLKLLLESIDHEGTLRFSDAIPYNEQMLSVVTNTNIDIVRSAMKIFTELNMMEVLDDGTFYMSEVNKMIGSAVDNDNANRVRRCREKKKNLALQNVTVDVTKCNESKSKSIEKELDTELEVDVVEEGNIGNFELQTGTLGQGVVLLTPEQDEALLDKLGFDGYNHYIKKLADFIIKNDATVGNHYATILKWAAEDSKVSQPKQKSTKHSGATYNKALVSQMLNQDD